jgi:hemerythrin-like metal-binding protein
MAYIAWSERFSVANAVIDQQHQQLFALIDQAHGAIGGDPLKEYESIWHVLSALLEYTRFHFAEEEGMLERAGYPKLASHKILHLDLLKKTEAMMDALEKGEAGIDSESLCRFIKEWIEHHVLLVDRDYMPYLAK